MSWGLLVSFVLNASLWGGASLAVRAAPPSWSALDRLFGSAVVGFVGIILGMESLSQAGAIGVVGLSGLSGAVLVVGLLVWWKGRGTGGEKGVGRAGQAPLSCKRPLTFNVQRSTFNFLSGIALLLAAWAALYYLLRGVVLPVETVSDAPIYHLPFAIRWWKAGSLEPVATPFGELAATYFPAGGDVWLCWLVAGSGSEVLAKVGQWPFLLLGAAAVFGLGRLVGAGRAAAIFPAAVWCSVPAVLVFSGVANVDLIFAAFYLIAVFFLTRYGREGGGTLLALFALSCGAALGTKAVGLAFAAPLVLVALAGVCRGRRRARHLAILLGGVVLPCFYGFARNLYWTGNPLYPLHVELFGRTVFAGWYDRSAMLESGYHLPTTAWRALVDRLTAVVDLRLLWLWPMTVLFGLVAGLTRRVPLLAQPAVLSRHGWTSQPWHPAAGLSLLALVSLLLYWFVVPYNSQERFLLPALALGLVPLGLLLEGRRSLQAVVVGLLAWHLLTPNWQTQLMLPAPEVGAVLLPLQGGRLSEGRVLFSLALPVSLVIAWIAVVRGGWWRAALGGMIVAGGCVISAWPSIARRADEPLLGFYPAWGFGRELFPAWAALERRSGPDGVRVAYAGTNLPYYLYGRGLRNEVRYVNVNRHAGWLPHDYHLERLKNGKTELAPDPWPEWYRADSDYDAWLANLRRERIDYLFVARENRHGRREVRASPAPFPLEQPWAQDHPEVFEVVELPSVSESEEPWVWLYRIAPPKP